MRAEKVVFLYTELAGYVLSCLRDFTSRGHKALVFHWKVNPEAPFQIPQIKGVEFVEREGMDTSQFNEKINAFNPRAVICSGWIDKGYLSAIRSNPDRTTVLLLDNQWEGGLKQRVKSKLMGKSLRKWFDKAWVPGGPQQDFAIHLGFNNSDVFSGFYSADTTLFNKAYISRKQSNDSSYRKTFLYVGRYIPHKGIYDMWEAFLAARKDVDGDWKLVCVGTGADYEKRVESEHIEHLGFKQPDELLEIIKQAGVFVLPSHFEPWGVVVHEMAAAGLPMILSRKVGAASQFLAEGENGFSFNPADVKELAHLFRMMMTMSDKSLFEMAEKSHQLGQSLSPAIWSETLLELL